NPAIDRRARRFHHRPPGAAADRREAGANLPRRKAVSSRNHQSDDQPGVVLSRAPPVTGLACRSSCVENAGIWGGVGNLLLIVAAPALKGATMGRRATTRS